MSPGPPCPLRFSPRQGQARGRGRLERSDSPQRWKESHVQCLILPIGTDQDRALTSPDSPRFSTHPRAHSELFTQKPHPYLPVTITCGVWNTSHFPSATPNEFQQVLWGEAYAPAISLKAPWLVLTCSPVENYVLHPNPLDRTGRQRQSSLLNITFDAIKLLEENTGKTFSDIKHTNVFLGQSPKATEIKGKINKWDLIKLTSFRTAKDTIKTKQNKKRKDNLWNARKYICK